MTRTYATPLTFKTAVEQRLRNEAAASGMDLQRRRQLLARYDCAECDYDNGELVAATV